MDSEMRKVDEIEKIFAGYVGQFSHFVVDKQLKDMNVNRDTITDDKLNEFAVRAVKAAIFDTKMQLMHLQEFCAVLRLFPLENMRTC